MAPGNTAIVLPVVTRLALRALRFAPAGGERLLPVPLSARVRGRRVRARVRWCRSDADVFREVFAEGTYDIDYERLVGPVRTVVDVGAHVGLASLFFRARFPGALVVSVEALPHNVCVLERNRRALPDGWSIVAGAVAAAGGVVPLRWSRWWSSGSIVPSIGDRRQSDEGRAEHRVAEAPLSVAAIDLADVVGDRPIDVLKVDIEGAEVAVLGDAPAWLGTVRCLLVEIHDKYVDGERVRAAIRSAGLERLPANLGRTEAYVRPRIHA